MRNLQVAALTAQLLLGSAYAAPKAPLAARKAVAAPAPNRVVERDGCGVTTYTVITPKPGMAPTPVTKQFQPVYSCIPQYVVCDSSNNKNCETMYSTTSYQWVSTAVPCYSGVTTVTAVEAPVTIAAYPTYAVETCTCASAGACAYGDYVTNVPYPTSFPYVNPGWEYYVCPYSDYYKYYSGGLSALEIDVYSCINGVCSVYSRNFVTKTYVTTNTYSVPYEINSYFAQPTVIVIGDLDITINISIAPTSISTVLTGTTTVTTTVTTTETETISNGVTVTDTTATASATVAPVGGTFVLGANVNVFAKKRQESARSFVVCSNGLCSLQQNCTNAALFDQDSNGRLISAGAFIYAAVSDITSGSGPLKLGTGAVTTGFSFNGGLLSWINAAFTQGDHEAQFCQEHDNSVTVLFNGTPAPAGCILLEFVRVDPSDDIACLGVNGPPISSSTSSGASSATSGVSSSGSGTASTTGSSSSGTATNGATATTGASSTATSATAGGSSTGGASSTNTGASSSATGTGSVTVGPTGTSATASSSSATGSISSIGGNQNLQICQALNLPTQALTDLCVLLNGIDPCSLAALTSLDALNACTNAGGTLPTNLVGCVSATNPAQCITSCSGLLDTLLLVETCKTDGGSPAAALIDCANYVITVGGIQTDILADVCVLLGGGNPCTGTAITGETVTDTLTYLTDCTLGGFLSTGLSNCLLTAVTDADKLACVAANP